MAVTLSSIPVTKVTIPASEVRFPAECSCCNAPADRSVAIEKKKTIPLVVARVTKRLRVSVPCCAACERNVKWHSSDRNPIPAFIVFAALGCGVMGIVGRALSINENAGIITGIVLGIVMGVLWLKRKEKKIGPQTLNESHVCHLWKPVFIRTFTASTITFGFLRDVYAQRFSAANGALVVEQSVLSRELL